MSKKISREQYLMLYGPTTGDKIRLADTDLFAEIEKDFTQYGEENIFGGGKTIRDGMAQCSEISSRLGALDLLITNVVVIDYTGIYKADIGITGGKIAGIGKAGNPDITNNITEGMIIGASTEVIAGEGMIATAGGVDTHVHFISPEQIDTALYSGVTTMIGGGTGPADGSNATNLTSGKWNIEHMLRSVDNLPMNIGLQAKGNCSSAQPLIEQVESGAMSFKIHEDWGSTPSVIKNCLDVADLYDVQVTIHTDSINEAGCIEDTLKAIDGRTIHTYHIEGAGGGHAPDIICAAGHANILPSSTTPTMPYTVNTLDEHRDMLMVCHHLDKRISEDVQFADSRIRAATIGAEDALHDLGAISMMSSDSQAMGRVGEVVMRTWQTADKMKKEFGALPEDSNGGDNFRIRRYVAKYTINPAITHGISEYVGSLEKGKLADIVLFKPQFFGVRPELILKGGMITGAKMGDTNASIPTPQPVTYRRMFGALGGAVHKTCMTFVSEFAFKNNIKDKLGLSKTILPVKNCRHLGKKDMKLNDKTPLIEVDANTYQVKADGKVVSSKPADNIPLAQLYNLF